MATTTTILYNDCYGGFQFSEAFLAEYTKRTGRNMNLFIELMLIGPESIRCDPTAIALFREKGSAWCSGPESSIAAFECPVIFERHWEIDEYNGDERVRILVSDALADILHAFMDTNDRGALDRQYAAIMAAAELKQSAVDSGDGAWGV